MDLQGKLLSLRHDDNAIARVIGGLVALLVGIIIGVMVFYEVNESILFTGVASTHYSTTWASINSTASTVWTMAPIVAIVGIAGIILAVIVGFGRSPGGGV